MAHTSRAVGMFWSALASMLVATFACVTSTVGGSAHDLDRLRARAHLERDVHGQRARQLDQQARARQAAEALRSKASAYVPGGSARNR